MKPLDDKKLTTEHRETLRFKKENMDPQKMLHDGDCIELNDDTLEVLETPGHADDHICLFLRKRKVLFTGNVIANEDIGYLNLNSSFTDSFVKLSDSLERCFKIDPRIILPGHGSAIRDIQKVNKKVMRTCALFTRNKYLSVPHTLITPVLFYIGAHEPVTEQQCLLYVLKHRYIFDGFLDNVTEELLRVEFSRLMAFFDLRNIVIRREGLLSLNGKKGANQEWIELGF